MHVFADKRLGISVGFYFAVLKGFPRYSNGLSGGPHFFFERNLERAVTLYSRHRHSLG